MSRLIWKACMMMVIFLGITFGMINNCKAVSGGTLLADNTMPMNQFEMFTQNNITFYDPNECLSTGGGGGSFSSSICGSAPAQKYWSALRQNFDETHAAAIMGSLINEGDYGVTRWEIGQNVSGDGGHFLYSWNSLYNCTEGRCAGVGSFGITWTLGNYLHYINDNAPDLLKYFQDPANYSFPGDKALERIGEADYNRLVELEISYVLSEANIESFKKTTDLTSSTDWWTKNYENCKNCCGSADENHSCEQIPVRRASAQKALDEFAEYSCGGSGGGVTVPAISASGSSGSSGVDLGAVTSDITLIGDSISVFSESELQKKFPNSFLNKVGSRHPTKEGWCSGDEGGLAILDKIVMGSGTIMNQHQGQESCEVVTVDSSALKENVVWALGTNSIGADENTLEQVLDKVGGRRLFLVTPFNNSTRYLPNVGKTLKEYTDDIAEMYRNFADSHDNVYLIDWNKEVRDNVSTYILSDNIHPTPAGTELFAKLIYDAMSGSKDCTTYSGDYPQYLQGDPKWKDEYYGITVSGNRATIGGDGCGPTSLAMLITAATGQDVLPTAVAELTVDTPYHNDGGVKRRDNTIKVCEKYGCEAKEIENSVDAIRQALKEGWMIHFSGGVLSDAPEASLATNDVATNPFLTNGHYIGIFSIDSDDNVMIADSSGDSRASEGLGGRFNRQMTLAQATAKRWPNKPIMAIRGKGGNSGKNTCEVVGNYCAAEGGGSGGGGSASGTIGEGGLTEEQAIAFMQNYGANKNNASKNAAGKMWSKCNGGGSNCSTFSVFFLNKFTDASTCRGPGGKCGNGDLLVSYTENIDKDNTPALWSVFSYNAGTYGHTGIVLGIHDGECIVGHASCSNVGIGAGSGTKDGSGRSWPCSTSGTGTCRDLSSGAGFIKKAATCEAAANLGGGSRFDWGHPKNVDEAAIERFYQTGE